MAIIRGVASDNGVTPSRFQRGGEATFPFVKRRRAVNPMSTYERLMRADGAVFYCPLSEGGGATVATDRIGGRNLSIGATVSANKSNHPKGGGFSNGLSTQAAGAPSAGTMETYQIRSVAGDNLFWASENLDPAVSGHGLTFEAWVNYVDDGVNPDYMASIGSSNIAFKADNSGNTMRGTIRGMQDLGSAATQTEWHHVALTLSYDAGTYTVGFFINGAELSGTSSTAFYTASQFPGLCLCGRRTATTSSPDANDQAGVGAIAHVALYYDNLDNIQLGTHYAAGL